MSMSFHSGALKKIQRFRSMPAEEVAYRMREAWRVETDRLKFRLGWSLDRDDEFQRLLSTFENSFKRYLDNVAAQRFYSSVAPANRKKTADVLIQNLSQNAGAAVEEAEHLCSHRLNLLGYQDVCLGRDIDWHRDPVSGHHWDKRFKADYDLVHDRAADAKVVQELNRHQHLPRLAKAFLLTGDERFAHEAIGQINSWIDQNAVWEGLNWHSSLEIAIRCLSWLWTIFLLLPSQALGERVARRISKNLFLQIDQIYRYPSIYSSPNTHLVGEAAALFITGMIFQELPRSACWRKKGAALLTGAMRNHVLPDGMYFELSPYYHCYATDFFLQAMVLARTHRAPFPDWMWSRLAQMIEIAAHLTRSDGTIPLMGDDDGGRALALSSEHYSSYRDGICSGAVLFGRSDFKHVAESFAEETLWLLGPDAPSVFASLPARPSNKLRLAGTSSGYFIQRSGWEAGDSHLVFDCGNHGSESAGHAHADALSINLFSGGAELLVDPATSVYNCASEWRNFFRSTRAHNTIVVDELDQSTPADTFTWSSKATTRVVKQFATAGLEYAEGEHHGYRRLRYPITHNRRVLYVRPNYWVVADDLAGKGEHSFDFLFHFAPGAKLFIVGEEQHGEIDCRARLNNQASLYISLFATAPMHAEALCGQISPIQGWASSRYGERKPAPVFKGTVRGFAPVSSLAFVRPGMEPGLKTRRLTVSGGRALSAVVRDGEFEDLCVMAIDRSDELRLMDFSMTGEFFWMRTQNGVLRQLLAVNASSFAACGEVVFREREPISHMIVHLWDNGMVIERGEEEGKVYVRDLRDRQFQRN